MFRQLRLNAEEEIQVAWLGLFYEGRNAVEFGPGRGYDHPLAAVPGLVTSMLPSFPCRFQ